MTPTGEPTSAAGSQIARAGTADSHDWIEHREGHWHWQIHPDWTSTLLDKDRPDWLNLDDDPRATLVKDNDGREVWRVELDGHLLFAKVSCPPRRWARMRHWLAGPDGARERRIADYAAAHQIDAIRPVAIADRPLEDREPSSIFVTEGLPDARTLNVYWSGLDPALPASRRIKNALIDATARLLAHAHQNGFEHRDLHAIGLHLLQHVGGHTFHVLQAGAHVWGVRRTADDGIGGYARMTVGRQS